MYQRITNNYINENVLNNLYTNRDVLVDLQKQIASGRRFERTSEDVLSSITVISSDSTLGKIENYLKNLQYAKSEIETTDAAIVNSMDALHKARELTIQGLNATSGTEELNMMAAQIEQIILQIKDIGNTKYGTKFIFGGKETSTPPFTEPVVTAPSTGTGIQYNGSPNTSYERNVEISEGVTISVNLCGIDIFGEHYTEDPDGVPDNGDEVTTSSGLLGALSVIQEQMASANPDKDIIRAQLDNLDSSLTNLLSNQATLGSILTRLGITESIHKDDKITVIDTKSGAQDIDYAKVISDLKFQEAALQASLQVGAQIIKPSLLNYI